MKGLTRALCALAAPFVVAIALAQGGQGGAAGGFMQGRAGQEYDGSAAWIEAAVQRYLTGNPIKNLMTPGEYSEWKLDMKAGQVVIAEAWSEAFDPALEIVDADGKVLKSNDDRYPGDQRPLLMWRCTKDGEYAVRARCFQDKFGGQFFVRSNVYRSVEIGANKSVDFDVDPDEQFLVRIPLKAGEICQVGFEVPNQGFVPAATYQAISPLGLPDIQLTQHVSPVIGATILAAADGDYYIHSSAHGSRKGKVRVKGTGHTVVPMQASDSVRTGRAATNKPALWSLEAKAGEVIEVSMPDLFLHSDFIIEEMPDLSKYDVKDDKKNPFFPRVPEPGEEAKGPAFVELPGRARDPRLRVFYVYRDSKLWVASRGIGKENAEYTAVVKPAPAQFAASTESGGRLRIGNTDYWQFDAKSGDVMTFKAVADGFAQRIIVRDPELREVWNATAQPDQSEFEWTMIARRPGRYLVAVSALGDGAAGTYSLNRAVYAARSFSKETAAIGDFSTGEVEVWKFTAQPGEPILLRWKSNAWPGGISVTDENGVDVSLPMTYVDPTHRFGILTVDKPRTYVIVLSRRAGAAADYSIELLDLPGYKTGN